MWLLFGQSFYKRLVIALAYGLFVVLLKREDCTTLLAVVAEELLATPHRPGDIVLPLSPSGAR